MEIKLNKIGLRQLIEELKTLENLKNGNDFELSVTIRNGMRNINPYQMKVKKEGGSMNRYDGDENIYVINIEEGKK